MTDVLVALPIRVVEVATILNVMSMNVGKNMIRVAIVRRVVVSRHDLAIWLGERAGISI